MQFIEIKMLCTYNDYHGVYNTFLLDKYFIPRQKT